MNSKNTDFSSIQSRRSPYGIVKVMYIASSTKASCSSGRWFFTYYCSGAPRWRVSVERMTDT